VVATKLMEPVKGRYQAAIHEGEGSKLRKCRDGMVDDLSMFGRQHNVTHEGEGGIAFPESQAVAWYRKECVGTWETLSSSPMGIAADKPKRARRRQCLAGSRTAS